jgi:hypothetical protein
LPAETLAKLRLLFDEIIIAVKNLDGVSGNLTFWKRRQWFGLFRILRHLTPLIAEILLSGIKAAIKSREGMKILFLRSTDLRISEVSGRSILSMRWEVTAVTDLSCFTYPLRKQLDLGDDSESLID